MFTSYILAPIY